nr:MAG TPA: hypothetical protein [Caudoviricetes sp.]
MRVIIRTVKRGTGVQKKKQILEDLKMKKYTVNMVNSVEMSEVDNKFYMMMDDRATLVVDMYRLSDEDIEGLKTIEGYDESPEVFERLMNAVVEEVE